MRFLPVIALALASLAVAFLFLLPIFSNSQNWGLYDWDQHLFYHESARISFLAFHQFPLWTPYYCGGNPLLANPQSAFLSPFFSLVLLFGSVVGLKLEAVAYLALGLAGTFLAARRLGCSNPASALASAVFMFSSWFTVRVVVGHTTFFPFALLPFVFLFYLGASSASASPASRIRYAVAAAVALAIVFLSGGIYPFYAAVILLAFYSLLDSAGSRRLFPVASVAAIFLLAALLSSAKLLPVVDFTSGVAAEEDSQLVSAKIILGSLLSRDQFIEHNDIATGRDSFPEGRQKYLETMEGRLPWGWHEYSAYVGIVPLLLAGLAAFGFRKNWKLLASAIFFFLLALGTFIPFGPWHLLRQIPFFSSLHGPSRFMIVFVFLAALLSARSLSSLRISRSGQLKMAVAIAVVLVVAADLALVSRPLLQNAFPLQPLEIRSTNIGRPEVIQMLSSAPYISQYPNLLQGIGTLNCYERLHLRIRAIPQLVDDVPSSGFVGNAFIAETNESLNFTSFSPQTVSLQLSGVPKAEAGLTGGNFSELTLVVNQNYYEGWGFDGSVSEAGSYRGLLAALIRKPDLGKTLSFSYSSQSFVLGAIISTISLLAATLLLWKPAAAARLSAPAAAWLRKIESYVFRQS